MSTDSQIAELLTRVGLLLDLPEQVAEAGAAQAGALSSAYLASIANLYRTLYVDQVNGSDTNLGTEAAPFKSIGKALSLVPSGGICHVLLKSDYVVDQDIQLRGQRLMLTSYGPARTLSFAKYSYVANSQTYRAIRNFRTQGHSETVVCNYLTVVLPESAGSEASYSEYDDAALFCQLDNACHTQATMIFHGCTITVNASRFGPLCAVLGAQVLLIASVVNGTRGHLRGRVFAGVTADAGVDPVTLRTFRSNLALV